MMEAIERVYTLTCSVDNLSKACSKDMNAKLKMEVEDTISRLLTLADKLIDEELYGDE